VDRAAVSTVYVLACYDEYGIENPVATLDRSQLPALLQSYMGEDFQAQVREEATSRLAELLHAPTLPLGKHDLMGSGWGGVQLYVIAFA
jgi:hypothetical protein